MRVTGDDTFTASQVETMQRVLLAARELPEVEGVAGSLLPPYFLGSSNRAYNRNGKRVEFGVNEVTDEFKNVLGLRIVQGRWFGREDDGASYMVQEILSNHGFAFSLDSTPPGPTTFTIDL